MLKTLVESLLARHYAARPRGARPRDLSGQVAVITGAAGDLGRHFTAQLSAQGARVAAVDVDASGLESVPAERTYLCDLRDAGAVNRTVEQLLVDFGQIDLLLNNAGITRIEPAETVPAEETRRVFEVNVFGAIQLTQRCLPALRRRGGTIVAISSVAGLVPLYGRAAYSASKHAMQGYFDTLRTELADSGVQVVVVCPSMVQSSMRTLGGKTPDFDVELQSQTMVSPEEVARRVVEAVRYGERQVLVGENAALSFLLRSVCPGWVEAQMIKRYRPATLRRMEALAAREDDLG